MISNKISRGEKNYKYSIGYMVNYYEIKPLFIQLLKTRAYLKSYNNETKLMYFCDGDGKLLEKYNDSCNKVSAIIKK